MLTFAPDTAQGSWLLAQALLHCDSARERIERAIADLRSIGEDCAWKAHAIELMLDRCAGQLRELLGVLDQLRAIESELTAG